MKINSWSDRTSDAAVSHSFLCVDMLPWCPECLCPIGFYLQTRMSHCWKVAAERWLCHRWVDPFSQCIGQCCFEPHPCAKMGGSVAGLGLYKGGRAGSCGKHFSHTHTRGTQSARCIETQLSSARQQTPVRIWNGYVRVGEFSISSAFRIVNSSPQTCWPLQWWSV